MNFEDYLYYDESSPSGLRWKQTRYSGKFNAIPIVVKNTIAGYKKKYWYVKILGKAYSVHRIILCLTSDFDYFSESEVDHLDGDTFNNRISNLKIVSIFENNRNSKMKSNNTTGYCGICLSSSSGYLFYRAQITANGKKYSKAFSIIKYGEAALNLAIQWREDKINDLTKIGVVFSQRHGKNVLDEAAKQAKIKAKSVGEKKE